MLTIFLLTALLTSGPPAPAQAIYVETQVQYRDVQIAYRLIIENLQDAHQITPEQLDLRDRWIGEFS